MSKIGKKHIALPKDTSIKVEGDKINVTGPKGSKSFYINEKLFSSKVNEKNLQRTWPNHLNPVILF